MAISITAAPDGAGVVFCRRRDFEAIGYSEARLCAEDLQFLRRYWYEGR